MQDFSFTYTEDGSVGLYDNSTKDILHSKTGALKESIEKFIYPTDYENYIIYNKEATVLDICFGIGYNTKAALYSSENNLRNLKLKITALEINSHLAYLSPFIKDGLNDTDINIYLLSYFIYNFHDFVQYVDDFFKINSDIVENFFRADICSLFEFYKNSPVKYTSEHALLGNLHNIYYQNISKSMKNNSECNKYTNVDFELIIGDARTSLPRLTCRYDFVFHDGFTPHKLPTLWTEDFFAAVKSKMKPDGILSTYTNSTPVRGALKNLGFNTGKVILNSAQFGTVASMNKNKIKYPLTDFDEGLILTKAGIPYRDNFLNASSEVILKFRNDELKNSDRMSSTEYKKRHKNEI